MSKLLVLLCCLGSSAWAGSSSCVVYIDGSGASQYSCDGSDLKDLFQASGITAAMSKSIPHFIDLGYALQGCTDASSGGPNGGASYSRCVFVKK